MVINEFLPNPAGSDQEGEYVKLFNDGPAVILLNGWSLKDASGKVYKLSGSLEAGQELILPYSQTKIALNNNGEQIFLYNAAGKLADQLSYSGQASEGQMVTKDQKLITKNQEQKIESTIQQPRSLVFSSLSLDWLFIDFLSSAILAGLGLYIIINVEKKLDIKLW